MAAEGLAPGDIAQALFVTSHTVQATITLLGQRLGVSSPLELRSVLTDLGLT
jgi:DNA-binding NarL/FixJ family response regulator